MLNKILKLSCLIFCIVFCSISLIAQTNDEKTWIESQNDTKKLKALQKKAYEFEKRNMFVTKKYAEEQNIPFIVENNNGEIGKLFTLSKNNKPIYIYNLDYGAIKSIESDKLYFGNYLGLNIEGQGMLSGVWEASSNILTNFFPLTTHNEFKVGLTSRISTGYDDPLEIGPFGITNHATFVCGNLIGNGENNIVYKGVAPKASILALTSDYFETEVATMAQAPYNLLVSNHSYGIPINDTLIPPSYFTSIFDDILTAAPYHLAVIAGGNYWMNCFSISKNVLSVGQSFETTNYSGPASVTSPNLFPFLGTPDFRIKPDLVTKSQNNSGPSGASDSSYLSNGGGTSYSAPAAAGAALLLQQLYKDYHPNFMKSATLKALMCHTTKEAGNIGPDASFGFGLLDVNQAAKLILNEGISSIVEEQTLNNSDSFFIEVKAGFVEAPLKVTIAWADPTSYDSNHVVQLINDLDVYVSSVSGIELPWGLDTTNPTGLALKLINNRDNIEKIEILNPVAGQDYKIVVKHKGTLTGGNQPFSLIVSGVNFCDDPLATDLIITAPVLSTDSLYEQAKNNITANNNFNTNSFGKYVAGREVKLTTGFTALNTSSFVGKTGNCIDSINVLMRNNYNPVDRSLILFDVNPDETKNEIFETKNLKPIIYPNPNSGIFTVIPKEMISGKLNILNQSGQLVFEQLFENENPISINISDNNNGIYFVVIYAKNGIFTEKIILSK